MLELDTQPSLSPKEINTYTYVTRKPKQIKRNQSTKKRVHSAFCYIFSFADDRTFLPNFLFQVGFGKIFTVTSLSQYYSYNNLNTVLELRKLRSFWIWVIRLVIFCCEMLLWKKYSLAANETSRDKLYKVLSSLPEYRILCLVKKRGHGKYFA